MRCNQMQLRGGLCGEATEENRGEKRSLNPNILRRRLERAHSINQNASSFVNKYNSNEFPLCCHLFIVLVCVAWDSANSVPTSKPYPCFNVADQVPYTNSKSKKYSTSSIITSRSKLRERTLLLQNTTVNSTYSLMNTTLIREKKRLWSKRQN